MDGSAGLGLDCIFVAPDLFQLPLAPAPPDSEHG